MNHRCPTQPKNTKKMTFITLMYLLLYSNFRLGEGLVVLQPCQPWPENLGETSPGGHYIAMLATSRALSGIFMWHARFDITCVPLVTDVNHVAR